LYKKHFFTPFKSELMELFNERHLLGLLFQFYQPRWLATDKQDALIYLDRMAKGSLCSSFSVINRKMWNDRDFVLFAAKVDGLALMYANDEVCGDKEVVVAAVQRNSLVFLFASPKLQADKEVVLAAVRYSDFALKYASPELQVDEDVIAAASSGNSKRRS
jgi:hypothetical protein